MNRLSQWLKEGKERTPDIVGETGASMAGRGGASKEDDSLSGKALSEQIMPTMRHFHAEVEVSDTYSHATMRKCGRGRRS